MSATTTCLRDEIVNKGPGPSAAQSVKERVLLSERIVGKMMSELEMERSEFCYGYLTQWTSLNI